jgi:hypothetical protein
MMAYGFSSKRHRAWPQADYFRHVETFVKFLGRSPERAMGEAEQRLSAY